ncbi:MAG: rhomboid family intramembrane serine protease [Planctomycetota bacterium]
MIIPYRVDVPYDRRPFANCGIIASATVVFLCQFMIFHRLFAANFFEGAEFKVSALAEMAALIRGFVLDGPSLKGLIGHMWLHGNIFHLLGNMLFLWVFGNAVCAKVGNWFYPAIYLGLGVMAGIIHLVFGGGPAIGASGAINGIVGMYLVFFPLNDLDCVFIFFIPFMVRPIIKAFTISSYWMILMWFAFDIWGAIRGGGRIGYFAHLGGFLGGVTLAVVMLKTRWVTTERYEKSLLECLGLEKSETEESMRSNLLPWQQQYATPEPTEVKAETTVVPEKPAPKIETISLEGERPPEEFIRFSCACGKRFKLPAASAGKRGRCPQCKTPVKIPGKSGVQAGTSGREAEKAKEEVLRFACSCGKRFRVPLELAGRIGRCPRCNGRFKIPEKPLA